MVRNFHFDFLAKRYDRLIGSHNVPPLTTFLELPVEGLILDVGGGTGRVSQHFSSSCNGVFVTDLSEAMLKEAQSKNVVVPVRAHAECLPFPDQTFQRVIVVDALHHFCDQERALADMLRVLDTDGLLVIEEPNIHKFVVKVIALLEKIAFMGSRFMSPETIGTFFNLRGYTPVINTQDSFASWIIVRKQKMTQSIPDSSP